MVFGQNYRKIHLAHLHFINSDNAFVHTQIRIFIYPFSFSMYHRRLLPSCWSCKAVRHLVSGGVLFINHLDQYYIKTLFPQRLWGRLQEKSFHSPLLITLPMPWCKIQTVFLLCLQNDTRFKKTSVFSLVTLPVYNWMGCHDSRDSWCPRNELRWLW